MIFVGKNTPLGNGPMGSQNKRKGDLFQTRHQSKENILHGHEVTAQGMEKGVIQQQRRESPAGKSSSRLVFPEDEHRLILQKFAAAIFQARIVSLSLQLLRSRS